MLLLDLVDVLQLDVKIEFSVLNCTTCKYQATGWSQMCPSYDTVKTGLQNCINVYYVLVFWLHFTDKGNITSPVMLRLRKVINNPTHLKSILFPTNKNYSHQF